MRQQIQTWVLRIIVLVLIVIAVQKWGIPLYRHYFVAKKVDAYIPTTHVKQGTFIVSLQGTGDLQAENSVSVIAMVGGKIISIIPEGTNVKPGQKLVELDTTDVKRELQTQELNFINAKADVDRANAELDILKKSNETEVAQAEAQQSFDQTELELAKKNLEKKTSLANDKLIPRDQVEQAELEVRSKDLAVRKGDMSLALKKKDVQSKETQKAADVSNVKFRTDMAKMALDDVKRRIANAIITAPSSGMVVISTDYTPDGRRALKAGDNVNPMQPIIQLPDLTSMQIKLKVGESDAPRLKIGIPTIIKLEAIPNKIFHGILRDISPLATESSPWDSGSVPGKKNFEVTVAVKEVDRKALKPGITANVEFICDVVKKAIFVPLESVVEQDGKTYVFIKTNKKFVRTLVKTGKSNDNFVCITKGLMGKEIIALRDPTKSMDEQESGTTSSKEDKSADKVQAAPIPVATKAKK